MPPLDTDLSAEQREYIETVKGSGEALLSIIDDILDFSKIEAGKLSLDARPFHVRNTVDQALRLLSIRAEAKGLTMSWNVAADTPECLIGDGHRLRQILVNLAGNAIKFTDTGSVRIEVAPEFTDHQKLLLHFQVTDTGIGISPDQQTKIFDSFSQADSSTTRRFGGTGLDLAIAARLVEMMGGQIQIESESGHGSTFRFSVQLDIPAQPPQTPTPVQPTPAVTRSQDARAPLQVLLVEDHLVNQRYAQRLLEKLGHTVRLAVNGRVAVDLYKAEQADLILMDIQMLVMDGFEATAEIDDAVRQTDGATIRDRAHALKGTMSVLAAPKVYDAALALEKGADGRATPNVQQEFAVLQQELDRLERVFELLGPG